MKNIGQLESLKEGENKQMSGRVILRLWNRFQNTGNVKIGRGQAATGQIISIKTIRNRFHKTSLHVRRILVCILLTIDRNKTTRRTWVQNYKN